MSRGRKLLVVGLVLAIGLGLAWPFRKSAPQTKLDSVAQTASAVPSASAEVTTPQPPKNASTQLSAPAPQVSATMASIGELQRTENHDSTAASFDLANHPALANSPLVTKDSPVTPPAPPVSRKVQPPREPTSAYAPPRHQHARPAYSTDYDQRAYGTAEQPHGQVRHVVQNSDTLEKLAKRYLGDEGRALEIFDLNRDVLDNPYLLPIDAELRIPADARVSLD